jgi:MerR family Zn(II)-responsive transcriptional regulator of zntA
VYTIGRLAHRTHVSADSIRYYERQGLLSPSTKTASGYRLYGTDAIRQVAFIKHAQRCGFSLDEIRQVLHMHKADERVRQEAYALVRAKQAEIHAFHAALSAMDEALTRVLAQTEDGLLQRAAPAESPVVTALDEVLAQSL